MPNHVEILVTGEGASLHCTVCGETCPVPVDLDTRDVVAPFLRRHPKEGQHPGGCPDWAAGVGSAAVPS